MSDNLRTLAEVSTYAFTGRDLDALRRMKGVVSTENPLRVHRNGEGFIVSLGMFFNGEGDAPSRLRALGLTDQAVEQMTKAADFGAPYLNIRAPASADLKPRSYLDLSTGHLRGGDVELLSAIGAREVPDAPVEVHLTEHGFVIDLADVGSAEELAEAGFSDDFGRIVQFANGLGSSMIDFDSDAGYEPGFRAFDHVTGEDVTADVFADFDEDTRPGMSA